MQGGCGHRVGVSAGWVWAQGCVGTRCLCLWGGKVKDPTHGNKNIFHGFTNPREGKLRK